MKVQENTEETPGMFSKEDAPKIMFNSHISKGSVSKVYFAERSIEMKARKILKEMATETYHQIRIAVQKPPGSIRGIFKIVLFDNVAQQNYYIVHFNKVKLRTGKTIWIFKKIDY